MFGISNLRTITSPVRGFVGMCAIARGAAGGLTEALAVGEVDHFVTYTGLRGDERFHLAVTELLAEHSDRHGSVHQRIDLTAAEPLA